MGRKWHNPAIAVAHGRWRQFGHVYALWEFVSFLFSSFVSHGQVERLAFLSAAPVKAKGVYAVALYAIILHSGHALRSSTANEVILLLNTNIQNSSTSSVGSSR